MYASINEQKACTRIFWKTEPPGQFSRDHRQVLLRNSWDHLAQEVLISTPRRFGKTISVSMFAAAMMFAAPRVELSIYSTCKRISQKLLRNVQKFFNEMVEHNMGAYNFKVIRQNMEEMVLQGPDGVNDVRIVNSYPSKVRAVLCCAVTCCASELCRAVPLSVSSSFCCSGHLARGACKEFGDRDLEHKPTDVQAVDTLHGDDHTCEPSTNLSNIQRPKPQSSHACRSCPRGNAPRTRIFFYSKFVPT